MIDKTSYRRQAIKKKIALRRALLTLRQAGELNITHIHGEMNDIWNAKETVIDFLQESQLSDLTTPPG